jgi:gliding motility-associated-like protein
VQPSGNYNFEWNNGATTNAITNLEVGLYTVTVINEANCKKELSTIIAIDTIIIELGNIKNPSCPSVPDGAVEAFPLNGISPYSYEWSNGENSKAIINLVVNTYTVTVIDANNCSGTKSLFLTVDSANTENCDSLIIYDVFSPNGDGKNDLWVIDGLSNYSENEIQIYNRWGSLIYEAKPYLNNWDGSNKKGEPLPSATYYYILKLNDFENKVYSGHVTIIR